MSNDASLTDRIEAAIGDNVAKPGEEIGGAIVSLSRGMLATLGVILGKSNPASIVQLVVDVSHKYDVKLTPGDVSELFQLYWRADDAVRGKDTDIEEMQRATDVLLDAVAAIMRKQIISAEKAA